MAMSLISKIFRRNKLTVKESPIGAILYQMGVYKSAYEKIDSYILLAYQANPTVFECVEMISSGAAHVPITLKRRIAKEGEDEIEEVYDHPALELIRRPNPTETQSEFFEKFYTSKLACGNGFLATNKKVTSNSVPIELWNMDARYMSIRLGRAGMPKDYKFQAAGGIVEFPVDQTTGESEVYHGKEVSLTDQLFGMSKLMAARTWVDVANKGAEWNAAMLENSGQPNGAMKTDGTLTDDQFNKLKERLEARHTGSSNAGRTLLLEGGLEWIEMSKTPKDMDFMASLNYSAKTICGVYGVPYVLVSTDASTFNNMETARQILWEDTITPFVRNFWDSFGRWLLRKYPDSEGLFFEPDFSGTPAYQSQEARKTDRIKGMLDAGIITINEAREELGYMKSDNPSADEIYIAAGKLPLSVDAADPALEAELNKTYDNTASKSIKKAAGSRKNTKKA